MEQPAELPHQTTPTKFFQSSSKNPAAALAEIAKLLESRIEFNKTFAKIMLLGSVEEKCDVAIFLSYSWLNDADQEYIKTNYFLAEKNKQLFVAANKRATESLLISLKRYQSLLGKARLPSEVNHLYIMLFVIVQQFRFLLTGTGVMIKLREAVIEDVFADKKKSYRKRLMIRSRMKKEMASKQELYILEESIRLSEPFCSKEAKIFTNKMIEMYCKLGEMNAGGAGEITLLVHLLCEHATQTKKEIYTNMSELNALIDENVFTSNNIVTQGNIQIYNSEFSSEKTFDIDAMIAKKTDGMKEFVEVFCKAQASGYFKLLQINDDLKSRIKEARAVKEDAFNRNDKDEVASKDKVKKTSIKNPKNKPQVFKVKQSNRNHSAVKQKAVASSAQQILVEDKNKPSTQQSSTETTSTTDVNISIASTETIISITAVEPTILTMKGDEGSKLAKEGNSIESSSELSMQPWLFYKNKQKPEPIQNATVINPHISQLAQKPNRYRDNFELMFSKKTPNRQMKFRDLCNMVSAAGGSVIGVGGSRYRLQLRNIYAEVIGPDLGSQNPEKVSFIAHAPSTGTKGNKKGHDFNGKVLGYVVELFRRSFERAGITPETLWPENSSSLTCGE